jgi:hypothetical protein
MENEMFVCGEVTKMKTKLERSQREEKLKLRHFSS